MDMECHRKESVVVSFVHRSNIGDTSGMDQDALSSATVYSGSTGEKESTIEVIRDTIKKERDAKNSSINRILQKDQ